jgi:hypothetical protein
MGVAVKRGVLVKTGARVLVGTVGTETTRVGKVGAFSPQLPIRNVAASNAKPVTNRNLRDTRKSSSGFSVSVVGLPSA